MSFYKTLNRTILAKVETVSGTDAAPVVGTNAVLIEAPVSTQNLGTTDTREVTGALDRRAPIPNGGDRGFTGRVYCKGSGSPGVTPPEVDPLLKGAALGIQSLTADVTGTAAAAAAGSITLAAGASAVDNFYRGMVVEITAGTGIGQRRHVRSYNGTTKVATITPAWTTVPTGGTYSVRACSLYSPISTALPTITVYDYGHRSDAGNSKLKKTIGAAGNARYTLTPKAVPYWEFDYKGQLVTDTDVTAPAAPTYQSAVSKIPFMGAQVALNDVIVALNTLSLDMGNNVVAEDDPNQTFGSGIAGVTDRGIGGTMRLPKALQSERDAMTSLLNGTAYCLSAIWGTASGNRFGLMLDNVVLTGVSDEDVNGFNYDSLPFRIDASNSGFFFAYF